MTDSSAQPPAPAEASPEAPVTPESELLSALVAAFPSLAGAGRIARARRLWVEVPTELSVEVIEWLAVERKIGVLSAMTGLDDGERYLVHYHLSGDGLGTLGGGTVVTVTTPVGKAGPWPRTITARYPAADAYERELLDLLGMMVEGLPDGPRYPLPTDWPAGDHPLRKDWQPRTKAQEDASNG